MVARLRELGFTGPFTKVGRKRGKHVEFMERGEQTCRLPNEHATDIGVDLLKRILNQCGVSREEWLGSPVQPTGQPPARDQPISPPPPDDEDSPNGDDPGAP